MRLVLVRHGQTTSNVAGLLDTAVPGADLTDLGREQAAALVPALADVPVDAVVVSDLVRTQQTAAPLAAARGLVPVVEGGLREVQAGDLEMAGDLASVRTYLGVLADWFRGDVDVRMPGGESGREVLARFDDVVVRVAASGAGTAVLVSHGAILRVWAATRAAELDAAAFVRSQLTNTGTIVVEGSPDAGWRIVAWVDEAIGGTTLDTAADGPTG